MIEQETLFSVWVFLLISFFPLSLTPFLFFFPIILFLFLSLLTVYLISFSLILFLSLFLLSLSPVLLLFPLFLFSHTISFSVSPIPNHIFTIMKPTVIQWNPRRLSGIGISGLAWMALNSFKTSNLQPTLFSLIYDVKPATISLKQIKPRMNGVLLPSKTEQPIELKTVYTQFLTTIFFILISIASQ